VSPHEVGHQSTNRLERRSTFDTMAAVKVLFSVRHATYVRHYDPVLRTLASRGHDVMLVSDGSIRRRPWPAHVEAMAAAHPSLRLDWTPNIAGGISFTRASSSRDTQTHRSCSRVPRSRRLNSGAGCWKGRSVAPRAAGA
jgi:hypothetical protein